MFKSIMFQGQALLSPGTVSFHYVKPAFMYMYDFLLYDLQRPQFQKVKSQE